MLKLEQGFYIGPWCIEPTLNRVSMQHDDSSVEYIVTPKVMALCLLLAENQGEPVSQQTIADKIWPGLAISDSSIYQAIAQLRKALHDNQSQKQFVERVSGRGYRLIQPVTPLMTEQNTEPTGLTKAQDSSWLRAPKRRTVTLFILVVMLCGLWFLSTRHSTRELPANPDNEFAFVGFSSIAIRPTTNLTQPRQEKLDTFNHLLLSDLLSIPDINLILMRDTQQRSDADIELTHSLSDEDGKLLLSAQLTEQSSQRVLWAAEFSAPKNALLDLKRQLTSALSSVLTADSSTQILAQNTETDLDRAHYESFALAQYLWNKREPEDLEAARRLYEEILQQYPDNIDTLVGLCNTYLFLHIYANWTEDKAHSACFPLIDKASQLSPQNGKVLATKALLSSNNDTEEISDLFETSIAQAPNYTNAYLWYGNFLRNKGDVEKALAMHQRALSLDPLSPNINRSLAYSLLNLRQLQNARQYYQRALTIEPHYSLRPVEELDFLPLNIERAQRFIVWSKDNESNLSHRAPYLLTQTLVRLGLGQKTLANDLFEQADVNQVNRAFWLYTQAALNAAQGKAEQASSLLEERYLNSIASQENTNRHVMPYLALLNHTQRHDEALRLFTQYFPDIQLGRDISEEAIGQFVFLNALLIATGQTSASEALASKIFDYFNTVQQPPLTITYIQWLVQSQQKQLAIAATETLFAQGWLPDFNDMILGETNLREAYVKAGGNTDQFNRLLMKNQNAALIIP